MEWTFTEKPEHGYFNGIPYIWIPVSPAFYKEVQKFKTAFDKPHTVTIKPERKKRSPDANSYMWVICDKIAKAIKSTKVEVYRIAIRDVGEWEDKPIPAEDVEKHIEMWGKIGDGWFSEERRDSKLPGHKVVRDYYGSHIYDTVSMSRLIDYIVEEAKELGIETMPPDDMARLKQEWSDKK